jgi:uncharacterized protein YydD (DUF2326 family)
MLKRLYSTTGLILKEVVFYPGINIILGRHSNEINASGENGIGKSSLIRLIDYVFLSETAQKIFMQEKYDFLRKENHDIHLEFNVESKSYYIKREFHKKSLVWFGERPDKLEEYSVSEIKAILTDKFFPTLNSRIFFEGNRFRTLMNFYVKDDLNNQKRFEPLNFLKYNANVKEVAIYNFYLLNLPNDNIIKFSELISEHTEFSTTIRGIELSVKTDYGKSIDEFRSEKSSLEKRVSLLEKSISKFEFTENYKYIEQNLSDLTKRINEKLDEYHTLNKKLNKIREGYQYTKDINTQDIRKMYNEMLSSFGDMVAKTLDNVIDFKNEILENRNKYLVEKEKNLNIDIKSTLDTLSQLERDRSKLYNILKEKGALDSITNTYEQLITEKSALEANIQKVKQVDEIQEKINNLNVSISEVQRDIASELKNLEIEVNNLRLLFLDILNNTIYMDDSFDDAYFNISPNKYNRLQLPFKMEIKIPKAEALGQARFKIVAYDLMVFLNTIKQTRKLPDFLIHDGVFHGISPNTMINTLNYMHHKYLEFSSEKQFQYILTFNESELFVDERSVKLDFNLSDCIIAEYEDVKERMIFKRILK